MAQIENLAAKAFATFNVQPHIDTLSKDALYDRLSSPQVPTCDGEFLWTIPHHHFKLKKGEVLIFDVTENDDGGVENLNVRVGKYEVGMVPYQWFSDGSQYMPVGFGKNKKFECELPNVHCANLGVISNLFPQEMVEVTYENARIQTFSNTDLLSGEHIMPTIAAKKKSKDGSIVVTRAKCSYGHCDVY